MRNLFFLIIALFYWQGNSFAQHADTINLFRSERVEIRKESDAAKQYIFQGKFLRNVYADSVKNLGLYIETGKPFHLRSNLSPRTQQHLTEFEETWHDCPVVTVKGKGTEVYYSGLWMGKNNYTKPILNIIDSAKFTFGKDSKLDLVFPAYVNFTRQLWVYSDGTGTLELEKGYIADWSEGGKVCSGTGCFRLVDCHLVTHDSASLPVYYRPDPKDLNTAWVNSHLVFEKGTKSRWTTDTQRQNFIGGVWLYNDLEIVTNKHLQLTGVFTHWSDYTNYGGLIYVKPDLTLTKLGQDTLTLQGETHFVKGSTLVIEEGVFQLNVDPFTTTHDSIDLDRTHLNGNYLNIVVKNNAALILNSPTVHLASLQIEGESSKVLVTQKVRLVTEQLQVNGTLEIIPSGTLQWEGKEMEGSFANQKAKRKKNTTIWKYKRK